MNIAKDEKFSFETVAIVVETGEVLGVLKWGWGYKDEGDNPVYLTGGTDADCVEAASPDFEAALAKYYEAKFETILDTFAPGSDALTPGHTEQLKSVVSKAKADPGVKVQCAGFADLKESDPVGISKKRAEAVKAHLIAQGVPASQIDDIVAYGSDWARAKTAPGADEPKNRRVQLWVRNSKEWEH